MGKQTTLSTYWKIEITKPQSILITSNEHETVKIPIGCKQNKFDIER